MTEEELIKNQFPNDEFLQSAVLQIVDKCTAELEKENTELKEKYADLEKKYFNDITDCNWCDTYCNSQLIKAKEIIKEFIRLEYADFTNGDYSNELSKVLEQAEQFLKEIE